MVGDIKIRDDMDPAFALTRNVASGTTASINDGEPTKEISAGTVGPMVDGDGSTSQRFSGVAKSISNETASAAGVVATWIPLPGLYYMAKAKVAANANTQALIDALRGKRVVLDLTAGVWTVDSAAADNAANCVVIASGEFQTSTLFFFYSPQGTTFFV